jgi:hypothetical protein
MAGWEEFAGSFARNPRPAHPPAHCEWDRHAIVRSWKPSAGDVTLISWTDGFAAGLAACEEAPRSGSSRQKMAVADGVGRSIGSCASDRRCGMSAIQPMAASLPKWEVSECDCRSTVERLVPADRCDRAGAGPDRVLRCAAPRKTGRSLRCPPEPSSPY